MRTDTDIAAQVMQRIDALAMISDEPGRLTRTYGSPAMRRANDLVAGWMRDAGMTIEVDPIGNLIGRYAGDPTATKTFLLGSHLDTVRDAGKFDGVLGVLVALACIQHLHETGRRLPFALDLAGFADEEGARFQSTYLGSRVLAGTFDHGDLKRTDASGLTLREAILRFGGDPEALHGARLTPEQMLGYAEVHIEQGPVLQEMDLPVGVVTAIAGQTRIAAAFDGRAAHAGTTPMASRRDALLAAGRLARDVETIVARQPGLLATVGQIEVPSGASNVVPGRARLTLDVRHAEDDARKAACELIETTAHYVASHRRVGLEWNIVQSEPAVRSAAELTGLLKKAAAKHAREVLELPSGAGHDAAALAAIMPMAMLFVRCKDGISHHPDESVAEDDVLVATRVLGRFLELLAKKHA